MDRASSPKIKAVILDYGEVLCYPPTAEEWARMAAVFDLDPQIFRKLWGRDRLVYDRGDISYEGYWSKLAAEASVNLMPEQLEKVGLWDLEMWGHVNPAMVDWTEQLRLSGIKVGLLSNMPIEMIGYSRRNFAWLKDFDHTTFSADVRLVKPEPAIYEHSLQGVGVEATEALFLDDKEANVLGAREVGMRALRFQSIDQLRNDLKRLDFPIEPAPVAAER
ncbi:MAG: HAD family hydrolase [Terriglobales bacterium]